MLAVVGKKEEGAAWREEFVVFPEPRQLFSQVSDGVFEWEQFHEWILTWPATPHARHQTARKQLAISLRPARSAGTSPAAIPTPEEIASPIRSDARTDRA